VGGGTRGSRWFQTLFPAIPLKKVFRVKGLKERLVRRKRRFGHSGWGFGKFLII